MNSSLKKDAGEEEEEEEEEKEEEEERKEVEEELSRDAVPLQVERKGVICE